MKKTLIILFLLTVKLYSQDYLNIKFTGDTYKNALISEISEITFSSDRTEITVTKTDASSTTDNLSTVVEMTFDDTPLGGALPVELVSFTAASTPSTDGSATGSVSVELYWKTATEVNNYGFSVLRLRSATENEWEEVGFVEGHGHSNSPKEYSFIDSTPHGTIKYRLKQIDTDGSFEYSNIVVVESATPKEFKLAQNYPNPFNPSTTIAYHLQKKGLVTLKVYDIRGCEVTVLVNEQQEPGKYKVEWNASSHSSGMYIYKLTSGQFTSNKKLLLIK